MHDFPIVCVLLDLRACSLDLFSHCFCVSLVTETDDYAEIVDEEDTYTMPSSKFKLLFQSNICQPKYSRK